ncbi:hypothetical protein [Candidatus Lokiarchaeum ossiferum]
MNQANNQYWVRVGGEMQFIKYPSTTFNEELDRNFKKWDSQKIQKT